MSSRFVSSAVSQKTGGSSGGGGRSAGRGGSRTGGRGGGGEQGEGSVRKGGGSFERQGGGRSKSAAVTELEREAVELKRENRELKKELTSVRSLYEQLVLEAPRENFSERRVNLLKSQVAHLERQVALQTRALLTRAELMEELGKMTEYLLETLGKRREEGGREEEVLIEKLRVMRARISRCSELCSSAALTPSFPYLPKAVFLRPCLLSSHEGVCAGELNHQLISGLESKLAQLYGHLTQLEASLHTLPLPPPSSSSSSSSYSYSSSSLFKPIIDHQRGHVTETSHLIEQCCHSLLALSVLAPSSASLTAENTPAKAHELTIDSLIQQLKPHTKNKKEVALVARDTVKLFNHIIHLNEQKCSAIERELQFHKSLYDLQLNYLTSLFEAVRSGYESFEQATQDLVCTPLKGVLASFSQLKGTTGEQELKDFLQIFQENEEKLKSVVDSLTVPACQKTDPHTGPQGADALARFGENFFESLHQLQQECSGNRESQITAKIQPSHTL